MFMSFGFGMGFGLGSSAAAASAPTYEGMRVKFTFGSGVRSDVYGVFLMDAEGNNITPNTHVTNDVGNNFDSLSAGEITVDNNEGSGNILPMTLTKGQCRTALAGGIDVNIYMKFDEPQPLPEYIYVSNGTDYWDTITFYTYVDGKEVEVTPSASPANSSDTADEMDLSGMGRYFYKYTFGGSVSFPAIPVKATGTGYLDSVIAGVCGEYSPMDLDSFDPDTDTTQLDNLIGTPALGESVPLKNGIGGSNEWGFTGTKGTTTAALTMAATTDSWLYFDDLKKAVALNNYGRTDTPYCPFFVICGNWADSGRQKWFLGSNDRSSWGPNIYCGTSQNVHVQQRLSNTSEETVILTDNTVNPTVYAVFPDGTDFCFIISLNFQTGDINWALNTSTAYNNTAPWDIGNYKNILQARQETQGGDNGFNQAAYPNGGRWGVTCQPDLGSTTELFKNGFPSGDPGWTDGDELHRFAFGVTDEILGDDEMAAIMSYMETANGKTYVS
jgi:hypothetical protein